MGKQRKGQKNRNKEPPHSKLIRDGLKVKIYKIFFTHNLIKT